MNVQLSISSSEVSALSSFLEEAIAEARPAINAAMGKRFHEIVQNNFGIAGVDRPMAWARLSPAYAKKVGREIATLYVTGALKSAVKVGGSEGESVTVSVSNSDVPYATVHQNGSSIMPKRPYFPIDSSGEVMPWTASEVTAAASKALEEELSK